LISENPAGVLEIFVIFGLGLIVIGLIKPLTLIYPFGLFHRYFHPNGYKP